MNEVVGRARLSSAQFTVTHTGLYESRLLTQTLLLLDSLTCFGSFELVKDVEVFSQRGALK